MDIKAVILDLDQTLTTDTGSWIQFTNLVGADPDIHQDIYNRFREGEISYPNAKKELIDLWRTTHKLDREGIAELLGKIELRDGAMEAVEYLKSKYKLCIISGAIDIFVEGIADKLGVEDRYAATKFIFDETDRLVDFDYKLSRGEEKVAFLHDFCTKQKLNSKDCAAIGDGESDMPIFNEVRLPILFLAAETSAEQKEAMKIHLNNWSEIKQLL